MLGSSYHFQDHCFSRQVYALCLSYANYPPILDNSAFYRQNLNKIFFFFGPISVIAHSTQNHIKKEDLFRVETLRLFSISLITSA